jgi:L-ascorbate metabolism protein UlaG (beta-lactamase superfamily)
MHIIYLNHSGFLLEWEHSYWIFDYYKGEIPQLDSSKTIFVFCSHSHHDHFNPAVFALNAKYPAVKYVFSSQVRPACRKLERKGELPRADILFLTAQTDTLLTDGHGGELKIHTLRSTDCGCAFVIDYEGKAVYHAGDLHLWTWPGEAEQYNRQMTGNFQKEMEYLSGKHIDLAFAPLDGRLEEYYGKGMEYLLTHAEVDHVFPMHFWEDYSLMERYPREHPLPEQTTFHPITADGQSWEIS